MQVSGSCTQGLSKLRDSSFSLYIACEGASGNYIGVILTGAWISLGSSSFWNIGDRFWYEKNWGDDVVNYYYSGKNMLYVATSTIYGVGGVYELSLKERKSRLIFPNTVKKLKNTEDSYSIIKVQDNKLFIKVTRGDGKEIIHSKTLSVYAKK